MTTLNLPDEVNRLRLDGSDWGSLAQRVIQVAPSGTRDDPTIIRVPELYRAVQSIAPRRPDARHIHIICDKGAGFFWPTLGVGHDGTTDYVEKIVADPTLAAGYKKQYRTRFGLGPIGGHGWKYHGILQGPKVAGMPMRSPSGPGARNCLEAQHAFWGKDFGYDLTDVEIDNGDHGWDLCGVEISGWWGDAFSPGTTKPNALPAREMHIYGGTFSDLGRIGILTSNVLGWSCRLAVFGPRIPSSIIHSETGNGARLIGRGIFEGNEIHSGANVWHITGQVAEYDGLIVRGNERFDSCVGGRIDAGPRIDGEARVRNVFVENNLSHKIKDGHFLGDYVNCDNVYHQRNVGPMRKGWGTGQLLRQRGGQNVNLAPNSYTFVPR